MAILVTGGTGFVGRNVVDRLAALGREVIAFDLPSQDSQPVTSLPVGVEFAPGDVTSQTALEKLVDRYTITGIIHAAAVTPRSTEEEASRGRSIIDVNFAGTMNVLHLARSLPSLVRIVYVSSTAVYGSWLTCTKLVEDLPLAPQDLYSIAKYASELACARWSQLYELDIVSARLTSVYGPYEHTTSSRKRMSTVHEVVHHALVGEKIRINGLEESTDWIHAYDVALGITHLLEARTLNHQVYNLGSGITHSAGDILRAVVAILPQTRFEVVPEEEANVRIDPQYQETNTDIGRIAADTCFQARYPLREGLAQYIEWLTTTALSPTIGRCADTLQD